MAYPNDADQAGNYTGALANVNEYATVPGVCVLPLAEDPPTDGTIADWSPVVVLRLHAPYRVRKFNQVAGKQRNPAPIAAPRDTGAFVFLGGTVTIKPELNSSYNDYDWLVACDYVFVENCTPVDPEGNPLGFVLGTLPVRTTIDKSIQTHLGYAPPPYGAAALGGSATTSGAILGAAIVNQNGELNQAWTYNAQSFYPPQLFYSDLPNGGKPVVQGGRDG